MGWFLQDGPTVKMDPWSVRREWGELLFSLEVREAFVLETQDAEAAKQKIEKCTGGLLRSVKSLQKNSR